MAEERKNEVLELSEGIIRALNVLIVAAIIIPVTTAFAQTPDIKWYTKNPKAKNYQISTADELAGLAWLVNNASIWSSTADKYKYCPESKFNGGSRSYEEFEDQEGYCGSGVSFGGKTITLTQDIDLSKYCRGKGWVSIGEEGDGESGYESTPFSGTFDGNGKIIRGMNGKNYNGKNPGGLFDYVTGTVKNLGIVDANIVGDYSIGGIVGVLDGGNVSNCYLTGTVGDGDTTKWGAVGGIVGNIRDGSVTNCYFAGKINGGRETGGIVGDVRYKATISNCYSTGVITGGNGVGGIVGVQRGGDGGVVNCYSTAEIRGKSSVGGIVGYVHNLVRTKEYNNVRSEVLYMKGTWNQKEKVFEKKLKTIKIFDTLNTAISNNIALNSSVKAAGSKEYATLVYMQSEEGEDENYLDGRANDSTFSRGARIVGGNDAGHLSNNAAFSGILNKANNTMWDNRSASGINGEDMTIDRIKADGTLGGRFTQKNGWTVQNGKLPGLFGEAVEMPAHLK